MSKFALLLAVGLLITIPLFSQETSLEQDIIQEDVIRANEQAMTFGDDASGAAIGSGPSVWAVIRMLLVLALAAAAIYGAVFFIKKTTKQTSSKDPFLKVLASSHLGTNRYVHVVYVGNKAWLVGSAEGCVNLIGEVDDKDTINAMLLDDSRRASETTQGRLPDFMSLLRRFGAPSDAGAPAPGADEIRKRRERLKGL